MASPKAGMKTMPTGTTKNEAIFNEDLILLEALVYRGVASRSTVDPSALSPVNGDIYLVPDGSPNSAGDWAGLGGQIAVYYDGWRFLAPGEGITLWITDESQSVQYRSGVWTDVDEFPATLLDDLDDVSLAGSPSPQDGDSLVYNALLGKWMAGGGSNSFAGCKAISNATTAMTSSAAIVPLAGTEEYDVPSGHHSTSTNSERIQALSSGYYVAHGQVQLNSDNFTYLFADIKVDSTTSIAFWQESKDATTTTQASFPVISAPVFLNAGQYVEMRAACSPSGNITGDSDTFLSLRRVGT